MFAPKNTPAPIVDKLYGELRKAAAIPEVKSAFAREGLELAVQGPRSLAETLRADTAKWQKIIRETNIVLE